MAERAHRLAPRSPSISDTYGWILFKQGSVDRALPLLEEASRSMPAGSEIHYHLGQAYAKSGKRDEARKALERALDGPRFAEVDEAKKLLDSLR
jgi:predicted Zn-dependent protease